MRLGSERRPYDKDDICVVHSGFDISTCEGDRHESLQAPFAVDTSIRCHGVDVVVSMLRRRIHRHSMTAMRPLCRYRQTTIP
jgi:hypothetical protein